MKLWISSLFFQNPAISWLAITLVVWWFGIAGRDLFLLPALIFVGIQSYRLWEKKQAFKISTKWVNSLSGKRWLISMFFVHVLLYLAITLLKYYSFRWNVWDVGNFSNKLYNISQGSFYSSYLGSHNWADHFSPSMSPLALLYLLTPSTHWVTLAKTAAYLSVPLLIFKICREAFQSKEQAWSVTAILGVAWMLFYAPALNSLYYEFQPSALAPPVILYAFLNFQREHWLRFWLSMIILLGFKEHLGAVWIGFGCYMVLVTTNKKTGLLLIAAGIVAIYLIMFQVMPYFRNYEETWSMVIGPFQDVPAKVLYIFKILIPLSFLPVLFWRIGILAGPAIGVNILSANPSMYSTSFHYDDLSATLLMIAMILIISANLDKLKIWQKRSSGQWLILVWLVCVFSLLPSSPMRELYAAIPKQSHREIRKELIEFDQFSKGESIAVQTSLGTQFHRKDILAITQDVNGNCSPMQRDMSVPVSKYLLFAKSLNHYLINDLEKCLKEMDQSKDYQILSGYQHIKVYKKIN
jgi:uncharacterized membrane protein